MPEACPNRATPAKRAAKRSARAPGQGCAGWAGLALIAAACGESVDPPALSALAPPPGVTLDGAIALADVVRAPMPVPDRFAAELPHDFAALQSGERGPPFGYARQLLCRGDASARAAWAERVSAADPALTGWELYVTWGALAQCGGEAEPCAWLRERYAAEGSAPAVQELDGYLLSQCDDEATAALIEAGPIGPAILWYRSRSAGEAAWSPRLEQALRSAVLHGDSNFAGQVAVLLATLDERRADALILGLRERATGAMRDELTISLWRSSDPVAYAAVSGLCLRDAGVVDPATQQPPWPECGWRGPAPELAPIDPGPRWVRTWGSDPTERVRRAPEEREAVVEALSTCVTDEIEQARSSPDTAAPWTLHHCLRGLAALDRPTAAALAPLVSGQSLAQGGLGHLRASLVRFPREGDLVRRAREIGLTQGAAVRTEAPVAVAEDLLAQEGRLYRPYERGWAWPVAYDELLADLAAMAPPLAEARFASNEPIWRELGAEAPELEPAPPEGLWASLSPAEPAGAEAARAPRYVLHAWHRGERWRAQARDLDEWPDLDATLGLLNRLLEAEGSALRYAETVGNDVVLAPQAALIAAERDSLLELVDPARRWADEQAAAAYE